MRACGAEFTSAAPMSMATNLAGALARRSCAISAQRPAAIDHACMWGRERESQCGDAMNRAHLAIAKIEKRQITLSPCRQRHHRSTVMLSRRCFVTSSASAGLAGALGGYATPARTQTLTKNARLLVGFPAGGTARCGCEVTG